MKLYDPIEKIRGIGKKTAERLHALGKKTAEDLLYTMPTRYEDGSRLHSLNKPDYSEKQTYRVRVIEKSPVRYMKKGLKMQTFTVEDGGREADLTLFNMPFMDKKLQIGGEYYIFGKPKLFQNRLQFSAVKLFNAAEREEALSIVPIYPLGAGIGQKAMGRFIEEALENTAVPPVVPDYLRKRYGILSEGDALQAVHRPRRIEDAMLGRQSLVFSEFLLFQAALGRFHEERSEAGFSMEHEDLAERLLTSLPFSLTDDQAAAWADIRRDMASAERMERLIQGDVGSGKTVLAFLAMAVAVASGYQAMMMAPTEILAAQHHRQAQELFFPLGVKTELLTGSMKAKEKRDVLENFSVGNCDILIGTHALFQEDVKNDRLGLTITDEQHRFGVLQREKLQEKVSASDRLIMTATPIPRSLGIVMYGSGKISSIRTMPAGRKPIETAVVGGQDLESAYGFMESFLKSGQQIYVVCPLIEGDDKNPLHDAQSVYQYFSRERFSNYGVRCLHGRLSAEEKNAIMQDFQENRVQILISTTVIEVGVNVPNANLLFVFDADRFGLSTLHQLRGRVGRGDQKAYCILHSDSDKPAARQRLQILVRSTDGFYIAEEDLKMRGGGDFFGTQQSGAIHFRIGDLIEDMDIMRYAKIEADAILSGGHLNPREQADLYRAVIAYENRIRGI